MANPTADFPTAIHTAPDISANANSALGGTTPKHTEVHGKIESEIVAVQTKIGKGASTPDTGKILTGTAAGESAWADPDTLKGDTGVAGAKGDTGAQGSKGDTGATGAGGAKGDTGTSGVAGSKGDTGTQGIKGDTGTTGATGATGSQGDTGVQGSKGDTGTSGAKGDTGTQGSKGDTGATGATGSQGDTGVTGATGAKGDTGTSGAKGDTGTSGAKGDTGTTGAQGDTGVTGAKGDTGTTGAKGDTGTTGAKGDTGTAGSKGDTGTTGAQGDTGVTGSQGAKGDTGTAGAKGDTGTTGATGAKGDTGATGAKGDTGTSTLVDTNTVQKAIARREGWAFPDGTINAATDIAATRFYCIKPIWYEVNSSGVLVQRNDSSYGANFYYTAANARTVRENSSEQFVSVSLADATYMNTLCSSAANRLSAINTLITFCQLVEFTGVELDWEDYGSWTATQYENYKIFLNELGQALHAVGLKLQVCVPPIWNSTTVASANEWTSRNSQGYYLLKYEDFELMPVDYIVIMAYDYQYDMSAGTANQPTAWLEDILHWAKSKLSDWSRIIAGIPTAGYSGATGGYSITGRTYSYLSGITGFGGASRDSGSQELIWANAGISYAAIDETAINAKIKVAEAMGISRVSLWHIGNNKYDANRMYDQGHLLKPVEYPSNLIPTPGKDATASGITAQLVAGEALVFGSICYYGTTGKLHKAKADVIAKASALYMCISPAVAANATGNFMLMGFARLDAWNWTTGALLYLDAANYGYAVHTAPSGTDQVIQVLGQATSPDRILFKPELVQVEHT